MTEDELKQIVEMAAQYWPKAQPYELGLLKKRAAQLDFEPVKEILESVRLESKFSTLPLDVLNQKLISIQKQTQGGQYIPCYALHQETGKSIECNVRATSNEGANKGFINYLLEYNYTPTDFILFIGEDTFQDFYDQRYEIQCKNNPQIRERTKELSGILNRRKLFESVAEGTTAVMETTKQQVEKRNKQVKELLDQEEGTKPKYGFHFDPDNPDDIPF
jgi:hypothetical protein